MCTCRSKKNPGFTRLVIQKWKDSLNVAAAEPHSLDAGKEAEVGTVTLKSNGNEALIDEPPYISKGDEALNDDFP